MFRWLSNKLYEKIMHQYFNDTLVSKQLHTPKCRNINSN